LHRIALSIIILFHFSLAVRPEIQNALQNRYPGKERLQHYIQESQFQYEQIQIEEFSLVKNILNWIGQRMVDLFSFEGSGHLFSGIMLAGFIFIVLYIILHMVLPEKPVVFFKNRYIDRKHAAEAMLADSFKDIDARIRNARSARDYPQAVYLIFLKILYLMHNKDLIQTGHEKTNRDYLMEVTGQQLKNRFREVIAIHESVRYGNYIRDDTTMLNLISLMDRFVRDLRGEQ
jgi:hypothetical protein